MLYGYYGIPTSFYKKRQYVKRDEIYWKELRGKRNSKIRNSNNRDDAFNSFLWLKDIRHWYDFWHFLCSGGVVAIPHPIYTVNPSFYIKTFSTSEVISSHGNISDISKVSFRNFEISK